MATRIAFSVATVLSAFWFPWPVTALLALLGAYREPLLPLSAGLLLDVLYYPGFGLPLATLLGAFATFASYVVRARLRRF